MPPEFHSLSRTVQAIEAGITGGLHLGAQLYVSRQGRVMADVALGESRPGIPLTPNHLMLWLSSGKPVTAVAVAQLWEGGLLDLDDRVVEHIPEFGTGGKEAITIRYLLTHTGGIRMIDVGWPEASWEEILRRIYDRRLEPRWIPGRKAGYHMASSWFVLGELVRRLDGRSFPDYVRQRIFEPLGMNDCWIGMPAARYPEYFDRLAPIYDTEGDEPVDRLWHTEERVTRASPGSNGWGPIRQLGRFYEMLLGGGSLDGARLLSRQTVEAMTARHRVGLVDHTFKHKIDWGLGVILDSSHYLVDTVPYAYGAHASARTFGHSGYRSSTGFADPEHGLVVALALNGTPADADHNRRMGDITAAIYEDLGLTGAAA